MAAENQGILEALSDAAIVVDGTHRITYANPAAASLFGWDPDELCGKEIAEILHPQARSFGAAESRLLHSLESGDSVYVAEETFTRRNAETVHIGFRTFPLTAPLGGNLLVFVQSGRDVDPGSEEYFRLLFTKSPVPMWVYDAGTFEFLDVNDAALVMYGYSKQEFLSMLLTDLYPQSEIQSLLPLLAGATEDAEQLREGRHQCKDGRMIDIEVRTHITHFRGQKAILMQTQNITERKRTAEQLEHRALHDPLTDLPNRALFRDRLGQAVRGAHRSRVTLALLFMDLNNFKSVNDEHGHQYGDLLLQEVGRRVRAVVRESDTVARFAGDEFAVLLPGTIESGAVRAAKKILEATSDPFVLNGVRLETSASIGIALYPQHGDDAETLTGQADHAMYAAKRSNSGYAVSRPRGASEPDMIAGPVH